MKIKRTMQKLETKFVPISLQAIRNECHRKFTVDYFPSVLKLLLTKSNVSSKCHSIMICKYCNLLA